MIEVITKSVDETKALASALGRALRGGEVFELTSDLGGGKTTFVKGLAIGLDITDTVQSPSFTISRIYTARDALELHHFDFYRLNQPGIIAAELAESLAQTNAIVAIEWGTIIEGILPPTTINVKITAIDDQTRRIQFNIPATFDYLHTALNTYKESRHTA